ncbi:protein kinase domain-containing protein [Paucisalibacillus globulus]|uniref:class III lanthionine synthetase LanKC N-terminal domain-containing protein n=1 Tax=Paucisalibacillus globulus TaxID=351095 RepID=UPI0004121413|nr:lanthionine synthetase LanC family protein [Paucisalibacillus globulus]
MGLLDEAGVKEAKDKTIILRNEENLFNYKIEGVHHTFLDSDLKAFPRQGWKIHISCFFDNYLSILNKVGLYCSEKQISFKYIHNKHTLHGLLSKNCDRKSAGKFITIYPFNKLEFITAIRELYTILRDEHGPYILTDKRYLDSKVIYYRYGLILPNDKTDFVYDGFGQKVPDIEGPYYKEKNGIVDPLLENKEEVPMEEPYLFKHYTIDKVIHQTNGGGIYLGSNKNGTKVVIKEARPNIGISEKDTVISFRKKESEVLHVLQDFPHTPKLIESFYDWEHYYSVQEYIEGETLREFSSNYSPVTIHESSTERIHNSINKIEQVMKNIISAFAALHDRKIALVDVSPDNIIIDENLNVYFIDMEDCFTENKSKDTYFVPNIQFSNEKLSGLNIFDQDKQKLGYLLMNILCNANTVLAIDRSGKSTLNIFMEFIKRYSIPPRIYKLIYNLIYNPSVDLRNPSRSCNLDPYLGKTIVDTSNVLADYLELTETINNQKYVIIKEQEPYFYPSNEIREFCGYTYYSADYQLEVDFGALSNVNKGIVLLKAFHVSPAKSILNKILDLEVAIQKESESFLTNKKYSLSNGALAVAFFYIRLYEATKNPEFVDKSTAILLSIDENGLETGYGKLIPNSNNTCSPYLNYSAGFIKVAFLILNHNRTLKLERVTKEYLKGIDHNFPNNPSYLYGLSGIADTFLDAYLYFKDKDYLTSAMDKFSVIRLFKFEIGSFHVYPSNHFQIDFSFNSGMNGISHFYKRLLKVYEENSQKEVKRLTPLLRLLINKAMILYHHMESMVNSKVQFKKT